MNRVWRIASTRVWRIASTRVWRIALSRPVAAWLLILSLFLSSFGSMLMADSFEKRVHQDGQGGRLHYRVHFPDASSGEARFPLVLFLHGSGERGNDNEAQLKHGARQFLASGRGERFPAIIVAPQCPEGARWVETDWGNQPGNGSFPTEPSDSMKLVFSLLDELVERTDVDPARLYVTGLSMGGYGSWYAAAKYPFGGVKPDQAGSDAAVSGASTSVVGSSGSSSGSSRGGFAAMLAICGGADPDWAVSYAATDLWAVHGDADAVVPVNHSREMVAAIALQGHPGDLRYTELPGVGHDSWTSTYASEFTYEWLFGQTRSSR